MLMPGAGAALWYVTGIYADCINGTGSPGSFSGMSKPLIGGSKTGGSRLILTSAKQFFCTLPYI
jgi:hypothetical protein